MPFALRLHPLEHISDPLLLPFLDLYESAFPPNERQPVSEWLALLHARARGEFPVKQLRVAVDGHGTFIGMAIYDQRPDVEATFLHFFAITASQRNHGWGTVFFEALREEMLHEAPGARFLVFESEHPLTFPPDTQERSLSERRLGFYRRLGARFLTRGVEYQITVPFCPDPTRLLLGICPLNPANPLPTASGTLSLARRLVPPQRFTRTDEALQLT